MRDSAAAKKPYYRIRFPRESSRELGQNQAFFFVGDPGTDDDVKLRFHDYDDIYGRPGLYEQLFYERLQCVSPNMVANRLARAIAASGEPIERLRVLDLGAGNGIVGEELKTYNIARLVGLDIIPSAKTSAFRDRPGIYDDYLIADMTALSDAQSGELSDWRLNAMTTVAALGFDDIPAKAFLSGVEAIANDGWIAFTIKADFLGDSDATGFADVIRKMLYDELVELHHLERYRHRLSIDGEPLFYFVIVARKKGPLPDNLLSHG